MCVFVHVCVYMCARVFSHANVCVRCDCPDGYLGKNCSQPDFCKDDSCPSGTRCQSLQLGFECKPEKSSPLFIPALPVAKLTPRR